MIDTELQDKRANCNHVYDFADDIGCMQCCKCGMVKKWKVIRLDNMTWEPNLSTYELKKGSNKLLWEAFKKIQPARLEYRMKDKEGVFALDTTKGILVAKRYIYGNIISAHKRAVFSAINQEKKLIMYIKNSDTFYPYNPELIWGNSEENIRGNTVMLNWNIGQNGTGLDGKVERMETLA